MENIVLIVALALIIVGAVAVIAKRRGRKGCCGSAGSYKPRKKKLPQVIATRVFPVEGMHCENCANRVTMAVNDIPDVAGVVNLKQGTLTVSYSREVPDSLLRERLQRLGYRLLDSRDGTDQHIG